LLGRINIGGFRLGVAAVLFSGIAFGAIDGRFKLAEPIWGLGLAIFVYTVGLSAGPGFVASLRRRGVASNAAVLVAIGAGAQSWPLRASKPTTTPRSTSCTRPCTPLR
jgi:putative transport protein